jgi:hypothetical protein
VEHYSGGIIIGLALCFSLRYFLPYFLALIDQYKLRVAWSFPVFSPTDKRLIGAFALYSTQARVPDAEEGRLIERSHDLISLVIAQHQHRVERLRSK